MWRGGCGCAPVALVKFTMFQWHFAKSLLVRKRESSVGSFLQARLDIVIWTLRAYFTLFFEAFSSAPRPQYYFCFKQTKTVKQLTCYVVANA